MSQLSFSSLDYAAKKKTTKREVFLAEIIYLARRQREAVRRQRHRSPRKTDANTQKAGYRA